MAETSGNRGSKLVAKLHFRGPSLVYSMATDELENATGLPWKLRLTLSDDEGRGMQVHSRLSEE